ncbi:hypothetical protein GPSY_2843 [Paraglaciecola psychrophila 170]|nr:hypothetical protein GPSY_2843 [Paraglaciecola psychrophila 170]
MLLFSSMKVQQLQRPLLAIDDDSKKILVDSFDKLFESK